MEIKRNLGDASVVFPTDPLRQTEFTVRLTDWEIEKIYRERQRYYQIEDIKSRIEEAIEDADDESEVYIGNTCMTADEWLNLDEELLAELAERFDKAINNNDSWMDSYWRTMDYVLEDEFTITENE